MKKTKVVLLFPASKVEEPIIYHLVKDYDLMVNILRATIDPHKQGRMVVELSGEENQISRGINYLERVEVKIEPLAEEIRHLDERCTSCTACVPICPTEALHVNRENWIVSFEAQKCVVCLSCLEVCPSKAMEIYVE
jgi:L-aspartate semialdehyde sulfurtransferase ferredoxin